MELLYSDILPLATSESQQTVADRFIVEFANADKIDIAVGYVSKASLIELDVLVDKYNIRNISLVMGMYYIEGMPESTYRAALEINRKWMASGIGGIRVVRAFKFHGKLYSFYKDGKSTSAIIGSANLSVIKVEACNRRQYEVSAITSNEIECTEISNLINNLKDSACSINIGIASGIPIIREVNTSLTGVDTVDRIPQAEVSIYAKHRTKPSFVLPIKVPAADERFMDDGKHYTKSNLNVCYATPRGARKARDWYETQFTVSKSITRLAGYPEKGKAFFVITDDGYTFKVHTTSDGNKQFSAVGDELILGRWVKGRLAAAGLVSPVNNTMEDKDRHGMITKEMLNAYGCDTLVLTKTTQQKEDENGTIMDVWFLSFESESVSNIEEE